MYANQGSPLSTTTTTTTSSSSNTSSTDLSTNTNNNFTSPIMSFDNNNKLVDASSAYAWSNLNQYQSYNYNYNYNGYHQNYATVDTGSFKTDDKEPENKCNKQDPSTKQENGSTNNEQEPQSNQLNYYPGFIQTQKIQPNTSKLSYTLAQLEILNAIYENMKYPNSVQKTMIGEIMGITRDQVKIWFQNKRRKETLQSQGKLTTSKSQKRRLSNDDDDYCEETTTDYEDMGTQSNKQKIVDTKIIDSVLVQLKSHQNAPSRLSSKRAKLNNKNSEINSTLNSLIMKQSSSSSLYQENYVISSSESATNLSVSPKYVATKPAQSTNNSSNSSASSSSSSSSATSSSSSSSSEEEAINHVSVNNETKFQVIAQPAFSLNDYVDSRYEQNKKMIKFYNNSNNTVNAIQPVYPTYHHQPSSSSQSYYLNDSTNKQYQNAYNSNYEYGIATTPSTSTTKRYAHQYQENSTYFDSSYYQTNYSNGQYYDYYAAYNTNSNGGHVYNNANANVNNYYATQN